MICLYAYLSASSPVCNSGLLIYVFTYVYVYMSARPSGFLVYLTIYLPPVHPITCSCSSILVNLPTYLLVYQNTQNRGRIIVPIHTYEHAH